MAATTLLLIALGTAVCAFAVLAYVNQREQARSAFEQKSRFLSNRAHGLENQLSELESLIQEPRLYRILGEELLRRYQALNDFDPSIASNALNIQRAKLNLQRYRDGNWAGEVNRIAPSSSAIRRAEQLLQAMRELLLRLAQREPKLQPQVAALALELEYTELSVEVISEIAQGHQLINQGEFVQANGHYFQAQRLLHQSPIKHPHRQALAAEVGELLKRKRASISPALMPEVQFNPSATAPAPPGTELEQSL